MKRNFNHLIHADEFERKMLEAADAIRKNAERPSKIKLHVARRNWERDKTLQWVRDLGTDDEDEAGEAEE